MMRGLDVASRWRVLTERQVANLVDMYETGRWRRYYDEEQFRQLMQESIAAVEAWRHLNDVTQQFVPRTRTADVEDHKGMPAAASVPAPAAPCADEPSRALQSLQSFSADFTRRGDGV
jgi:uncharacterized repeat protein (TIGR03809 family)